MSNIRFDYSKALPFVGQHEIDNMAEYVKEAHNMIHNKTGAGNDFLGWVNLPTDYDKEEFARIKKAAEKIRSDSDVLVVIGIGGSYLGARAAVEMLQHSFYNALDKDKRKGPAIFFAGNNISSTYMADLLETVEGKDISVNVISKSGTTTEPAIAFRIFKDLLEKKYGKEGAKERIYATTDKARGALKSLADEEGYETFVIADDISGGPVPAAGAGTDHRGPGRGVLAGARVHHGSDCLRRCFGGAADGVYGAAPGGGASEHQPDCGRFLPGRRGNASPGEISLSGGCKRYGAGGSLWGSGGNP